MFILTFCYNLDFLCQFANTVWFKFINMTYYNFDLLCHNYDFLFHNYDLPIKMPGTDVNQKMKVVSEADQVITF